jgi:hypothetical protein
MNLNSLTVFINSTIFFDTSVQCNKKALLRSGNQVMFRTRVIGSQLINC